MIIIVFFLAVILAVIAYNMYQESQYRKQVREQFGHSDRDALLNSKVSHVRDGKEQAQGNPGVFLKKPSKAQEAAMRNLKEQDEIYAAKTKQAKLSSLSNDIELSIKDDFQLEPVNHTVIGIDSDIPGQSKTERSLVSLEELSQVDLPWLDSRFDYLAYIALSKAQELHALPKLSEHCRVQIIGCTMDDRFCVAEPIPGVYYQGFVIGLQAVSRNGLAAQEELLHFNRQIETFAQLMGGKTKYTDLQGFTEVAQALDTFCARVDQTIAIHLVSEQGISSHNLRTAVETLGFKPAKGHVFYYDNAGSRMFTLSPMSGDKPDSQVYQGCSMLFDIPHVPAGEKNFDLFMELAVKLSDSLHLNLVNDNMEEVSAQWLKDVRTYVLARQEEMQKIGIKSGSKTALRLFS